MLFRSNMRKSEFEWVAEMRAAYSKQLVEQRASMGVRIEADRQIIERLRSESAGYRFVAKAYDEALDEVTIEGQTPAECIRELRVALAESERGKTTALDDCETLRIGVESLRAQLEIRCKRTEPNRPPEASHDTVAGKAAAEEVNTRSVAWAYPVERYSDPEPELYQPSEAERAETARIRAKWAQRADPQSEGQP